MNTFAYTTDKEVRVSTDLAEVWVRRAPTEQSGLADLTMSVRRGMDQLAKETGAR